MKATALPRVLAAGTLLPTLEICQLDLLMPWLIIFLTSESFGDTLMPRFVPDRVRLSAPSRNEGLPL